MKATRIAILGEIATALARLKAPPSVVDARRLTNTSPRDLHSDLKRYGASADLLAVVEKWVRQADDAQTLQALQALGVAAATQPEPK